MAPKAVTKALQAVAGHRLEYLDAYMTNNECTKDYVLANLPLQPLADMPCATNVCTQAFDVIKDVDIPDLNAVTNLIVNGGKLPPPLGFKVKLQPGTVQYVFIRESTGHYTVVKHMHFNIRANIQQVKDSVYGDGFGLNMNKIPARRNSPLLIQQMLQGLGGTFVHKRIIVESSTDRKLMSEAQIDAAFDYIEEHAPLKSSNNAHIRWVLKQKNDPQSPLFDWPENRIKEAIHNLQSGTSLAKKHHQLSIDLVRSQELGFAVHSEAMLEDGHAQVHPLCWSFRHWQDACCLCSRKLHELLPHQHQGGARGSVFSNSISSGFFRSEPGSVFIPSIYDDGDIASENISSLKAYLDVAAEDAKVGSQSSNPVSM